MLRIFILSALISAILPAWGDNDAPPLLENAEIQMPLPQEEFIEPEVNIIHTKDALVEEYRRNGRLFMVKITPVIGAPYYFIDHDGDGSLEYTRSDIGDNSVIPHWILLSW
jgi:hypothetical protein